ncbi:MAG: ATP-binding protein [Streptococcaceae bacterium]|jgi:AAA+ ATPase superfamily predicted ATPase|nr:ATP-binding protein [Streptococcaceae bacterium]
MFVGRKEELGIFKRLNQSSKFEFLVMYGRRRIGKTYLIDEFVKNKRVIYFMANEGNDKMNLDDFSEQIFLFFNQPKTTPTFTKWPDAFAYLFEQAKIMQENQEKLVLIIDEYTYAAEANKSLGSMLQHAIDHKFKKTNLFLILCGSHVGLMENEVIGKKAPLHGRRTESIRLKPFNYLETGKMLANSSIEDKIKYYACLGGTPYYLSLIDETMSFEENIKRLYFQTSGLLYNEPIMLMKQELKEPANYHAIIQAIALGQETFGQIAEKAGIERTTLPRYLNTLQEMELITKTVPFGENPEKSRKSKYALKDNMFRFWYQYLFKNKGLVERGFGYDLADEEVLPTLSTFVGKPAFEEICLDYLIEKAKLRQLSFFPLYFGSWWGADNLKKEPADADIIVANEAKLTMIIGECKWRNEKIKTSTIDHLLYKGKLFPNYAHEYYFFSKSGFDTLDVSKLGHADSQTKLYLITGDDLFRDVAIEPVSVR